MKVPERQRAIARANPKIDFTFPLSIFFVSGSRTETVIAEETLVGLLLSKKEPN